MTAKSRKKPRAAASVTAEATAPIAPPAPSEEAPPGLTPEQERALDQLAAEDVAVSLQGQIDALPLDVQTRVRTGATLAAGLQVLMEASRARGQVNDQNQPVIDPDEFVSQVLVPICQVLATDLQDLGFSLDLVLSILSDWWTRPRGAIPEGPAPS